MIKVIKRIIDILFVLVIILLICYFALRGIGKIEIYQVETGSMEDGIHPGDYVLILEREKYYIGDIVTYRMSDYYVTHRIIKSVRGDTVITKGDANNTEDEEINVNVIEGKVIYSGGALNFVINYKYALVSFLLGLYLLSCYFGKDEDSKKGLVNDKLEKDDSINCVNLSNGRRLKKRIRPEYRTK